jgi:hypothetical protein
VVVEAASSPPPPILPLLKAVVEARRTQTVDMPRRRGFAQVFFSLLSPLFLSVYLW